MVEASRDQLKEKEEQSLVVLHGMLSRLDHNQATDTEEIKRINVKIQQLLPSVSPGAALPHRKTPSGHSRVLHMNYMRSQTDPSGETELAYLRFFAKTASALGLHLDILTDADSRDDIALVLAQSEYKALQSTLTISQHPVSKWAEDSVEYLENGTVALLSSIDHTLLNQAMTAGRQQRWQGQISPDHLTAALADDHLWIPLGTSANLGETVAAREIAARLSGQRVSRIRAYIEGGNMLTGEDITGNLIILIGKDAISTTAYLYQLNDDQVKAIICEDFGLTSVDQVIGVEQPGQFHLDMGLLFIGQGVVVVNDSSSARQDAMEMAELVPCLTTEQMAAKLTLRHALENAAVQDLQAAGLQVIREVLAHDVFYNFVNGEFVIGIDGCHYYITNGGPPEQEARFETLMVSEWQAAKQVIFSPQTIAHKSLQERGGVGCRLKGSRH